MTDLKIVSSDRGPVDEFVEIGVRNLHLISGEDILGFVYVGANLVRVSDALIPNIQTQDGKNFRVALMPYRPYLKRNVELEIPSRHIMFFGEVTDDMERLFREQTGRIVTTDSSTIVTP